MFNRVIEFRGKTVETNEWLYGSLIVREKSGENVYGIITKEHPEGVWVHPNSVGQLTGMKLCCENPEIAIQAGVDVDPMPFTVFTENNEVVVNKIYEGDIVLHCPYETAAVQYNITINDLIPCVVAFSKSGTLSFWEYDKEEECLSKVEEWSDGEIDSYLAIPSASDVLIGNYFDNPQYVEKPKMWKKKGK